MWSEFHFPGFGLDLIAMMLTSPNALTVQFDVTGFLRLPEQLLESGILPERIKHRIES